MYDDGNFDERSYKHYMENAKPTKASETQDLISKINDQMKIIEWHVPYVPDDSMIGGTHNTADCFLRDALRELEYATDVIIKGRLRKPDKR